MQAVTGIHHITAMTGDAAANVREYRDFWGLRLIKQTVNFDDPSTYHLYYGDDTASPGTALTYFPWVGLRPRRAGTQEVLAVAYHIDPASLDAWEARLRAAGRPVLREERFNQPVLVSADADGFAVELVGALPSGSPVEPWAGSVIPAEAQARGFHSLTLRIARPEATARVLEGLLGFTRGETQGARTRFIAAGDQHGRFVDLLEDRTAGPALPGAGSIHHVAFRVPDAAAHAAVMEQVRRAGLPISGPIDRSYFTAAYFREPNGILFEISTDTPGFTIDETREKLGETLQLPPQYAPHRAEITRRLSPLPPRAS